MKKDKNWLLHEVRNLPYELERGYLKVKAIDVVPLIDQLDEPEKVVVPQFVVDEFDYNKKRNWEVDESKDVSHILKCAFGNEAKPSEFLDWVRENPEDYVMAFVNGYEIVKGKLYYVVSPDNLTMLYKDNGAEVKSSHGYLLSQVTQIGFEHKSFYQLTEKEIKGFDERYWAFAAKVEDDHGKW